MRLRTLSAHLVVAGLLVSGCASGDDEPTTAQAAKQLTAWSGPLETQLTRALETLRPWQTTDDASQDQTSGCEDGQARRTYAATLDVSDRTDPPDADNREALLLGQLGQAGWDPSASSNDDTTGTVTATRAEADDTGTKLTLDFSPVAGGWHYQVTARTACLPTG